MTTLTHYWSSETRSEINKALIAFQLEGVTLDKDREVPAGGSRTRKYITLDNILRHIRNPLAKHGLFIEQHLAGELFLTRINHVSGEYIMSGIPFQEMQGNNTTKIQNAGGGITYLRRYALISILGLAADEDDDGATTQVEVKKAAPVQKVLKSMDDATLAKAIDSIISGGTTIDKIGAVYSLTTMQFNALAAAASTVKP